MPIVNWPEDDSLIGSEDTIYKRNIRLIDDV